MEFQQLFHEDYTDIVTTTVNKQEETLSYYERFLRLYNDKFNRHLAISDFELWMFSKLAYSNNGTQQRFIERVYNQRYHIEDFITTSDGLQFYVIKSRLTKDLIIAFRGTDEWVDWLTNIQILNGKKRQFETAIQYLEKIFMKFENYYIYFCGHSLGGALAQHLFVHFQERKEIQLKRAVTFNSAGVRFRNDPSHSELPIYNYVVEKDLVGNSTGYHYGNVYYCEAKTMRKRLDPLKIFTHTLDQFAFNEQGSVMTIDNLKLEKGL